MLSPAFCVVKGRQFKITRSDDLLHTALLKSTGDCLGGQIFRAKITSYGNFRNGTVCASDGCQGNCTVQYGGQLQETDGFGQATCNRSLQQATQVGFWCDWDDGDGAVLMIGLRRDLLWSSRSRDRNNRSESGFFLGGEPVRIRVWQRGDVWRNKH